MKKFWSTAAMVAVALLWGGAFSAQSAGLRHMDALAFTATRLFVAALALTVVTALFDLARSGKVSLWGGAQSPEERKRLLAGGLWCGLVLAAACVTQQTSLRYITAGKCGFLAALYIVIVPLLGLGFGRRTTLMLWAAVALALAGSYLLCGGVAGIGRGELLILACAGLSAVYILIVDRYAPRCDCVRLSCIQFFVAAGVAAVGSVLWRECWNFDGMIGAVPYLLYCGLGSSGLAFTLQIAARRNLHPVTASLLMSLESVFAVLGGWLFLGEALPARELAGCGTIFMAVVLAQLPPRHLPTSSRKRG